MSGGGGAYVSFLSPLPRYYYPKHRKVLSCCATHHRFGVGNVQTILPLLPPTQMQPPRTLHTPPARIVVILIGGGMDMRSGVNVTVNYNSNNWDSKGIITLTE